MEAASSRPARRTCRVAPTRAPRTPAYQNIVNDLAVDPKNPKHLDRRRRLARRRRLQRLLRVEGRRRDLGEDQPGRRDQPEGHRLRDVRVRGRRQQALRDQRVGQALQPADRHHGQHAARRHLRLEDRDPAGPWSKIAESDEARELRLCAQAVDRRQGLRARRAGLVQPVPRGRPGERRTTSTRPRRGLRDHERRRDVDDDRPVLELLLLLLAAGLADAAERQRRLPAAAAPRPALGRVRHRRRQGRTSTSATTAASTAVRSTGTVNANGNGTDWKSPQRRDDGRAAVLLRRRRQAERDDAARPTCTAATPCSSAAACRTTAARCSAPGGQKMVSNFGGDGGDVLVDPADGCNIVQEYVYLTMRVTKTCANPGAGPSERVPRPVAVDDDRHLAARRERAVHRAVHGERQEHQPVAGRGHEPLVPGQGLRHHVRLAVAEGVLAADGRQDVHGGLVLGQPGVRDVVRPVLEQRRAAFARGAVVGTFAGRHVDVQAGRVPGRLPEPLPAGRGDRPEGREPPDRGRQRVLAPLHRRPGRRHRPHLRVEGRRPDLDGHLGRTSPTSRSTTSSRSRAAVSSRRPTSEFSIAPRRRPRGSGSAASCRSRSRWT